MWSQRSGPQSNRYLRRTCRKDADQEGLDAPLARPMWVGLFPIRRIDVYESEIQLISDGCGVVDECGLLYRRGPVPDGRDKTRVKHLGGPWYHLYSVF